jgi:hypothetical protein
VWTQLGTQQWRVNKWVSLIAAEGVVPWINAVLKACQPEGVKLERQNADPATDSLDLGTRLAQSHRIPNAQTRKAAVRNLLRRTLLLTKLPWMNQGEV